MNLGLVKLSGSSSRPVVELGGGQSLEVSDEAMRQYPRLSERVGDEVAVGLRPEHFVQSREAPDAVSLGGRTVTLAEMLGSEMLVHFETDVPPILSEDMREAVDDEDDFERLAATQESGQTFVARFEPGAPPKVGEQITVGFDAATCPGERSRPPCFRVALIVVSAAPHEDRCR